MAITITRSQATPADLARHKLQPKRSFLGGRSAKAFDVIFNAAANNEKLGELAATAFVHRVMEEHGMNIALKTESDQPERQITKQLIQAAEDFARANDVKTIKCRVDAPTDEDRKFYECLGYEEGDNFTVADIVLGLNASCHWLQYAYFHKTL